MKMTADGMVVDLLRIVERWVDEKSLKAQAPEEGFLHYIRSSDAIAQNLCKLMMAMDRLLKR